MIYASIILCEQALTRSETAIFDMVLTGASNADIALARGRSACTVGNQLVRLYAKLGVHSRRELTAIFGDGARTGAMTARASAGDQSNAGAQLTRRERQVLAHVARGRANKAIGFELGIAASTVATLLARARAKIAGGRRGGRRRQLVARRQGGSS